MPTKEELAEQLVKNKELLINAKEGNLQEIKLGIKNGADINSEDTSTPLMSAAVNNHLAVVEYLIKAGAELDKKSQLTGMTALMYAAEAGHDIATAMLIEAGANTKIIPTTMTEVGTKMNPKSPQSQMIITPETYKRITDKIKMVEQTLSQDPLDLPTAQEIYTKLSNLENNEVKKQIGMIKRVQDNLRQINSDDPARGNSILNQPITTKKGETSYLIIEAIKRGNQELVSSLLTSGASTKVESQEKTVLAHAMSAKSPNPKLIATLTNHDAKNIHPNIRTSLARPMTQEKGRGL